MALFRKEKGQSDLAKLHSLLSFSFKNVQKDTAHIMGWLNYLYHKNLEHEGHIKQLKEELNYTPRSKEEVKKIIDEYYSHEPLLRRISDLKERIDELKNNQGELNRSTQNLGHNYITLQSSHEQLQRSHLGLKDEHASLHRTSEGLRHSVSELQKSHESLHQKHHEIGPKIEALKTEIKMEIAGKPLAQTADITHLTKRLETLEQKRQTIKEKIIKRITKNSKDYVKSIMLSYIKKYGKITALQLKEMVVEEQGLCSKSSFYRLLDEIEEEPEIGVIKEGKE